MPKELNTLNGYLTYKDKIYAWVFDYRIEKLTVKNGGADVFSLRIYVNINRERITNAFIAEKIKNWLQYGTPTPELSKSDPYDGIDSDYEA